MNGCRYDGRAENLVPVSEDEHRLVDGQDISEWPDAVRDRYFEAHAEPVLVGADGDESGEVVA